MGYDLKFFSLLPQIFKINYLSLSFQRIFLTSEFTQLLLSISTIQNPFITLFLYHSIFFINSKNYKNFSHLNQSNHLSFSTFFINKNNFLLTLSLFSSISKYSSSFINFKSIPNINKTSNSLKEP